MLGDGWSFQKSVLGVGKGRGTIDRVGGYQGVVWVYRLGDKGLGGGDLGAALAKAGEEREEKKERFRAKTQRREGKKRAKDLQW